jgi:hypothetical protein
MLFPPTSVKPPDVILLVIPAVFPLEICSELNPGDEAEIVIVEALEAKPTLAPATRETLDEEALRLKLVATGAVGPTIVILEAPELKVMFAPATSETLLEVPFRLKLVAIAVFGPEIVMFGLVLFWDNVMLFPATNPNPVEEAVFAVPTVAPPAAVVIDTSVE